MPYEYEIPAVNGKPLVEIPKELKDKVIDYTVLRDKIIIKASDLVDQLLYDTRVKVRDELGRLVKSITEYSYPPTASAIVCKDEDYVYAYRPANNYKGYILIDKGEAGVEDAKVIQKAIDIVHEKGGGKVFIAADKYKGEINPKPNVVIEGEGFATVLTNPTGRVIHFNNAGFFMTIRNLNIEDSEYAIIFRDDIALDQITIENVIVRRCTHGIIDAGSKANDIFGLTLNHVKLYGIKQRAISFWSNAQGFYHFLDVTIDNLNVDRVTNEGDRAVHLAGMNGLVIQRFTELGFHNGHGMVIDNVQFLWVDNMDIEDNYWSGLILNSVDRALINNLRIATAAKTDSGAIGEACLKMLNCTNIEINNIIAGTTQEDGNDVIVVGGTSDNIKIKGGTVDYSARYGIRLSDTVTNCIIEKIKFIGITGAYDILEEGNSDHNKFINNICEKGISWVGANTVVEGNTNFKTRNSGTATFSGDGSTTDFLIGDHGLAVTDPNKIVVKVTPISADAIAASPCVGYVDPNDNTKIRVKFASAPASGTDNVKIAWTAEVIS